MNDTITIEQEHYVCEKCKAKPTVYFYADSEGYAGRHIERDCGHHGIRAPSPWKCVLPFPALTEVQARIKAAGGV